MNDKLEQVLDYIRTQPWQENEKLPSVRILSTRFKVSARTISQAIRILEQEGVVIVHKKSGVYFGTRVSAANLPATTRWQQISQQIEQNLLLSNYEPTLPTINDLMRQFDSCAATVRRALADLVKRKIIVRFQKQYTYVSTISGSASSAIRFFSFGHGKHISVYNDHLHDTLNTLELECHTKKVNLIQVPIATHTKPAWDPTDYGHIIWCVNMPTDRLLAILDELATGTRPVAIIDEIGEWRLPQYLQKKRTMKVFSIAGFSAGVQIGRYLLNRGHRRIAFATHVNNEYWSRERYRGLCHAFERAGMAHAVTAVQTVATKSDNADSDIVNLVSRDYYAKMRTRYPDVVWNDPHFTADCNYSIFNYNTMSLLQKKIAQMQPHLHDVTAWVGVNDYIASCLSYIFAQSGGASRQVQLAGFDDSNESLELSFPSYNFNVPAIARQALSYICNPNHEYWWNKSRIECEGMLIQR